MAHSASIESRMKIRRALSDGETLSVVVEDEEHGRLIAATDRRLLIIERDGSWPAINRSHLSVVEVRPTGRGEEVLFTLLFGGGLERVLGVPDEAQALMLAAALS
ncbi:MAG: hypothetical protein QM708_05730 [Propioniciclava sp.]|uniref:hypothetical protein n=1 Tax=Propioniciclava sp. TaxID=2038686 RepID=UPI0039E43489